MSIFQCQRWLSKSKDDGKLIRELAAQVDGANTVEGTWMSDDFALHFFPCYVTVGETYAT